MKTKKKQNRKTTTQTLGPRRHTRRKHNAHPRYNLPIPASDLDITAVIDTKAIEHNVATLRRLSGTDLMPVLKSNAYGHGMVEMARTLRKLGIRYLGVATLGEAILLRRNGDTGRILAWLYDIDGPELTDAFHLDIDIAIFDEKHVDTFLRRIPKNKQIKVTVFVDTGINRAGVPYDKAFDLFKRLKREAPKVKIEGMMSHLVCSGIKNSPIVNEQLRKFRALRQRLATEAGIVPPLVHIANTEGCLNYDVSDFTLARPGSGIYGVGSDASPKKPLKLVMSLKTRIIQIKEIPKGAGVGYDWAFVAPKKMSLAVLPIGYADILPRDTSLKLFVYIRGTKRRVLGKISMDQILVESKPGDKEGDEVYVFGNGRDCPQTVFDVAKLSNQIHVEILCHAGYRVRRKYV